MGILNVGTQALQANLVALQTAGNNIANVNTPGYSRQKVILQTVPGQFTGGGYVGKGVSVQNIERNFSEFLTRQATLAASTQASDTTRADKLKQLEGIFEGGASGLGAAINDMMNAFSDVASAPTDLTARTVVLTRINETASRIRAASQRLDDLQSGISQEISQKVDAVNSLAKSIAEVNDQIAKASGTGKEPNDLLDRRDQLVKEINQYIQTTSIINKRVITNPADQSTSVVSDGTVSIFIGGSQALVLGTEAAKVEIGTDDFGDTLKNKLVIKRGQSKTPMDENLLGGGEVSGLLRFQNSDLAEGRNLLGRITMALTTSLNTQHKLGLDLAGVEGKNLFNDVTFSGANVMKPVAPATLNTGNADLTLSISDPTKFVASDYEVNFTSATAGNVTRRSDGVILAFTQASPATDPVIATLDGIKISISALTTTPAAGDRFLLKPFSTAANGVTSQFSTPSALAVASSIATSAGTTNKGSLAVASLVTKTMPLPVKNYSINFTGPNTYDIVDNTTLPAPSTVAANQLFVPGKAITYDPGGTAGWSLTLTGAAAVGDTMTVKANPYTTLSAGNATAMMNLRDAAMFDGAALTDGYAGMISQIGIRTQSANYAATVSTSIASNLERDRTGVSGVNLDEEGAKLLQYQQAYQASAKMIQIAQNIFDTLIQGLGR
jgi:flagellar hook-associated protein 1 FlgK